MPKSRNSTFALVALLLLLASAACAQGLPDLSGGGSAIRVGPSNEAGSSARADSWTVAMQALRQVLDPAAWTWRSGAETGFAARMATSLQSQRSRAQVLVRGGLRVPVGSRQP